MDVRKDRSREDQNWGTVLDVGAHPTLILIFIEYIMSKEWCTQDEVSGLPRRQHSQRLRANVPVPT